MKRAWKGPIKCVLFQKDDETLNHLGFHCAFTKEVWKEALQLTQGNVPWIGKTLRRLFR